MLEVFLSVFLDDLLNIAYFDLFFLINDFHGSQCPSLGEPPLMTSRFVLPHSSDHHICLFYWD